MVVSVSASKRVRHSWAAGLLLAVSPAVVPATEPGAARQAELLHLLRHDCGSCHGLRLNGGLGPALLPAALADKPMELLVQTILEGRAGTAMPPWRTQLSTAEAQWLVRRLRRGIEHE